MSDGRTFVTKGHIALDAALAKPRTMPAEVLGPTGARLIEGYFAATLDDECSLGELKADRARGRYVAPSGLWLSADYVDYLRRVLPSATRLRMKRDLDPVVIVLNGTPVGVLMALRGPSADPSRLD